MSKPPSGWLHKVIVAVAIVVFATAASLGSSLARPAGAERPDGKHVLLISVDGLHASDLAKWVAQNPSSNLAALTREGTTYANATSSAPSDSFPGLVALVTGGTPKSTGVYYDDSYDRTMWAPSSNCSGPPGAETVYAENLDKVDSAGNIPLFTSIDPAKLPLAKDAHGACVAVYPHSFLRVNTIFNIAHNAGLYTAWSDKHPAYDIVNGPTGDGVNDLFTPEINNVNDPTTQGVTQTATYDQLKVKAILNQIDGKDSSGTQNRQVPAIFGMNFQAVSVGQKLVDPVKSCVVNPGPGCDPSYVPGGYLAGSLAFTPQMTQALTYVDGAIGSMVKELRAKGLMNSTELIITAKHGQSPIDPSKLQKVGDAVTTVLNGASVAIAQNTSDDVSLIWLKNQGQPTAAVNALQADKHGPNVAKVDYVLSGGALASRFADPLRDSRAPDLIVQPVVGTIYTGSKAKVAEHGGLAEDDHHVALLVVNGGDDRDDNHGDNDNNKNNNDHRDNDNRGRVVGQAVNTTQVAPSILDFLGLNERSLDAVRIEHTDTLPER